MSDLPIVTGSDGKPREAGATISLDSIAVLRGELTRPTDTAVYASNDLVGANTSVNDANVIEIANAVAAAGQSLRVERVRLAKSTNTTTSAQFRLHFFESRPTLGVGDNGALGALTALTVDSMRYYAGYVDVTINRAGNDAADGAVGVAVPVVGTGLTLRPVTGTSIFLVIQALAAYTPASAEKFWPVIEGVRG
jgi:hypothetical protein